MRNLILSTLSTLALLIYPPSLSAQNSFSISLDVDGAAGDQAVTSLNTSADQVVAIQIFGNNIQNANGLAVRFEYDSSQVTYKDFDTGDVLPNAQALPEQGTGFVEIGIASLGSQATANSGLTGTVRFRTTTSFSGTEIRLVRAELSRGGRFETVTLNTRVELLFQAVSPDFDGDSRVGFADFLAFGNQFGARQGDGRYEAKYDLDSDGAIGFGDFLIFGRSFGQEVSAPNGGGEETQVTIPDANLRAVIETALGKASGAPITRAEMATLTRLNAERKNISDLTGLEFATSLTWLNLRYENLISDVSALSGLTNLTYLDIEDNLISDISTLAGLTNLTGLNLNRNLISDISALAGLTSLETLRLSNNLISDVSPLSKLTNLTQLMLNHNLISDVSPLSNLIKLTRLDLYNNNDLSDLSPLSGLINLKSLQLWRAEVSDLSPLSGLTNLTWLALYDNNITDVSPLSGLTNLIGLGLSGNIISDISSLSSLTRLKNLFLRSNIITDVSPLSGLTDLTGLNLDNNSILDVSPLSGLTNLTRLALANNSVSDVSPLSGLTNLTELWLYGNTISNISHLSGLTNLSKLYLRNNSISDISLLAHLTNLISLGLANNSISDLSPLSGLVYLRYLNLSNNAISDLAPLVANTGLGSGDEVDVRKNPLSTTSLNTHIPALQGRGVSVQFGASKPAVEEIEPGMIPEERGGKNPDLLPYGRAQGHHPYKTDQ